MKSLTQFTAILILIVLESCSNNPTEGKSDKFNKPNSGKWTAPVYTNDTAYKLPVLNTDLILSAENSILYIGAKASNFDVMENKIYGSMDDSLKRNGLKVFVDTTGRLPFQFYFTTLFQNGTNERSIKKFQGYPVFIYNPTQDTIFVYDQDNCLFMIQEAKNESGEWKPIEYWNYSWCGNSYVSFALIPNHMIVNNIIRYSGEFKTKIRLKLRNGDHVVYSNVFNGSINRSQFSDSVLTYSDNYIIPDFLNINRFKRRVAKSE